MFPLFDTTKDMIQENNLSEKPYMVMKGKTTDNDRMNNAGVNTAAMTL